MKLFHELSQDCSRLTTEKYSTSFYSAIKLLHKELRAPIFNIYGFVRFVDEIVDSFHDHDKSQLLLEFRNATYDAIKNKISLNPILNSFQLTVNEFRIDHQLIDAFFYSMEMDLEKRKYDKAGYEEYIYGSAEVVGLMCLTVFCNNKPLQDEQLKPYAKSLGAAFQKVNFLRDLRADFEKLNRVYFPGCDFRNFSESDKSAIEMEIQKDFDHALEGIQKLPIQARFGVYVAYKYYFSLFNKIKKAKPHKIMQQRIRVPDYSKIFILAKAGIRRQFNML
ncbi:MAG: phytoene/squalene synthase family protein [Chitinophagaceae bacterium]|nr:phytoene/squalene synthase family protein [Chitinophagaceae bacterium]